MEGVPAKILGRATLNAFLNKKFGQCFFACRRNFPKVNQSIFPFCHLTVTTRNCTVRYHFPDIFSCVNGETYKQVALQRNSQGGRPLT